MADDVYLETFMKLFRQTSPSAAPLALAISVLFFSGDLRASGPGGTGGVSGTASGGGASAAGGSHGSVETSGGGHGSFSAPAIGGARSGVSFSNSAPRSSVGVFSQSSLNRGGFPVGYAPGTRAGSLAAGQPRTVAPSTARITNAWSGTAVNPTGNGTALGSGNPLYRSNGYTNNRFAGRPNAAAGYNNGLSGNRYNNNGHRNGRYGYPYRYYGYPYAYGAYYAPYIGYSGGYYGAYPYYGDGSSSDIAGGYDNGTATVTPQYGDQGQDAGNNGQPNPAPQTAAQNPNGNNAAQGTIPNNGPDSLVEAVQQELIRRGYFGGKVDAMYGADTKEALRKFQQDHHLADSGLINEATLHALQLD